MPTQQWVAAFKEHISFAHGLVLGHAVQCVPRHSFLGADLSRQLRPLGVEQASYCHFLLEGEVLSLVDTASKYNPQAKLKRTQARLILLVHHPLSKVTRLLYVDPKTQKVGGTVVSSPLAIPLVSLVEDDPCSFDVTAEVMRETENDVKQLNGVTRVMRFTVYNHVKVPAVEWLKELYLVRKGRGASLMVMERLPAPAPVNSLFC